MKRVLARIVWTALLGWGCLQLLAASKPNDYPAEIAPLIDPARLRKLEQRCIGVAITSRSE